MNRFGCQKQNFIGGEKKYATVCMQNFHIGPGFFLGAGSGAGQFPTGSTTLPNGSALQSMSTCNASAMLCQEKEESREMRPPCTPDSIRLLA